MIKLVKLLLILLFSNFLMFSPSFLKCSALHELYVLFADQPDGTFLFFSLYLVFVYLCAIKL